MHKIARAAPGAFVTVPVLAFGFVEVCHRRKLWLEDASSIVATLQLLERLGGIFLCGKLHINVAQQMFTEVVAHHNVLHTSNLVQFLKDVFVKVVKVLLEECLVILDWVALRVEHRHSSRIGVHVRDEDGL